MGTSVAFHLAEAGVDGVLLLERDALGSGSTSKAAGGVRAQFSDALNIQLGARGLEAFERFADRPGGAIDLQQIGYLFCLSEPDDLATFEAAVALQNELGVASLMLSAGEAAARSPYVASDDLLGAAFHARDGICSPDGVVQGYATAARRLGAELRTGVTVSAIEADEGGVRAVVTDAGRVTTGSVVCVAGAWSEALAATAGVHLPVTPLKRQIVVTGPLADPRPTPMTIDAASTFYFHREGPGMLMGLSYDGEEPGFDLSIDDAWLPSLVAAVERRAPALADVGIAHRWAGLYEVSPDHNALIGEATDRPGFFYATGFTGHGFLQGPAVGEVIRDLWLGREPFVDVSPLSADRFSVGALRPEHHIV
jgi:glycine/D-amino acid oxidase-like deaminating enzyme